MPYPPHYLLSWGGDFASEPSEIWTNNLRIAVDDNVDLAEHQTLDPTELAAALADAVTRIKAHMAHVDSGYSNNVRLKFVKLNEIGPDGRYADSTDSNSAFQSPTYTSGTGAPWGPVTTSLVVTFLTSAERGPGSRGRVFVPQPSKALNSSYRWAAATQTAVTAQWRSFLDGIEYGGVGNPMVPSVVSNRGTSGVARTINQTQMGDFPDYMGSRRNRLIEARITSATFN